MGINGASVRFRFYMISTMSNNVKEILLTLVAMSVRRIHVLDSLVGGISDDVLCVCMSPEAVGCQDRSVRFEYIRRLDQRTNTGYT